MNATIVKSTNIIMREIAIVKNGAEKVCNIMYGTQKRSNLTIIVCFAAMAVAIGLNQLAAHGGFCAIGN